MSNPTPSSSPSAIAVSLVPKAAALIVLAIWLTGSGSASTGKFGLVLGALAFLDAVTLASLRKGSVAVGWPDISLIFGSLIGPAVLPLYTAAIVGVITLGGNDGPEPRRMLGSPGMERLASASPSRFTAPSRNSTASNGIQSNPGTPGIISGPVSMGTNPNGRPTPQGVQPSRPGMPTPGSPSSAPPATFNASRPPNISTARPTVTPSTAPVPPAAQRPITAPSPATTGNTPPAAPTQTAKP